MQRAKVIQLDQFPLQFKLNKILLMLVIMTYNVWVFICTVGGLGIGFFLCEWHRPKTHQGSCQRECSKPISRVNTGYDSKARVKVQFYKLHFTL
jgi:hypothetical protein